MNFKMPVLATVPSLPFPTAPSPTVFVRGLGELFGHSPGMLTMWSRIRWTGYLQEQIPVPHVDTLEDNDPEQNGLLQSTLVTKHSWSNK